MAVICFGGALRHSKGGPPNGPTSTVRRVWRNPQRGTHAARCKCVTYNAQMWPSKLGKPIEGDLGVDVDETELEFLGLDEQLPRERTEEFEGLDDAEEVLEDDVLRFAGSFDHKGVSPCDVREMITLRKERRAREDGILEALRRNRNATANLQHEASESSVGLAGAGSETKGACRNKRAKTKKRSGAGLPQRHGNGGRGQQPAPPQGASDKTSGKLISMHSSASPGTPPELPAAHGPLPGDDETARPPLPVSMLSPWAASKRPAGALSPTDVALFPTSPCTAEGCLKEASHTPGTLPLGRSPGNPLCGISARSAALY